MDEIAGALARLIGAFKTHGLEPPKAIVVGDPGDRVRLQMLMRAQTAKELRDQVRGEITMLMGIEIRIDLSSDVSDGRTASDVPDPFTPSLV
jgi:hypothetical protein